MKPRCIAAVIVLSLAVGVAPAVSAESHPHVRISDRILKALVDRGISESPTFQSLVALLDAAPIVAFVSCDQFMRDGLSGRLNFVSSVGSIRYVQVTLRCTLPVHRQLSMLAHELQHALEIAGNPTIEDTDSMESYYEEVGFPTYSDGTHRGFETDAAMEIQRRVYREMTDRSGRSELFGNDPPAPSP